MTTMRIDKFISSMGIDSRKQIKIACKRHQVLLNDRVVKSVNEKIDCDKDVIKYKGDIVEYEPQIYIMMNKPAGVISATEDNYHQTVIDLLEEKYQNREVFPVGRLDIDTVGLLLLTDDGQLAHNVLSPKKHVEKTYLAQFNEPLDEKLFNQAVMTFQKGVVLEDGYICKPAKIERADAEDQYLIKITEGKFHQVKRMVKQIGREVIHLKRLSYGAFQLDEALLEGEYKKISYEEVKKIMT